jgi:hypothetical protein
MAVAPTATAEATATIATTHGPADVYRYYCRRNDHVSVSSARSISTLATEVEVAATTATSVEVAEREAVDSTPSPDYHEASC